MANYYGKTRTNYFKVTDEEKFKEIMEKCRMNDSEDGECCPKYKIEKNEDGDTICMFYGYGSVLGYGDKEDPTEFDFDSFGYDLCDILPEGEAIIIRHIGSEKFNYLNACATIITSESINFVNFDNLLKIEAKKILEDDGMHVEGAFVTRMDY